MLILEKEERILREILFYDDENLKKEDFISIDYENLIMIASENLMIPALYCQLKKKKYLKYIPNDFEVYIREIYTINKNRNEILLREVKGLNNILKTQKIKHIFLKGASYINNIYKDLGERMIGDIDFLVDNHNLKKTISILKKNKYANHYEFKLWKTKHSRRLVNKNRLFAVEPHTEIILFRNRKTFQGSELLINKNHQNTENLLKICILNAQINDYGNLYAKINLRAFYDFKKIIGEKNLNLSEFNNKYYRRFLILTNLYGISKFKFKKTFFDKVFLKRVVLKRKIKVYRLIDNYICWLIKMTFKTPMQLIEFIINSEYRSHILKKIN
tara:strand:- start:2554 stop:3543 length:990 start_codon:yes stop_codon:yes gene_type:complete